MTQEHIVTDAYAGPERRKYVKTLEQLEQDIIAMFAEHEAKEQVWIKEALDGVLRAFPDGDVEGHCRYHNAKIQAAKAEEEFWKVAKEEATKRGIGAIFVVLKWIAILSVLGLAYKFGFGPLIAKALGVTVS